MVSTSLNFYNSQSDPTVIIQVSGGNYGDRQRRSNYTLSVPYSRLSQTIQQIHRTGGKITGITRKAGYLAKLGSTAASQEQQTAPISSSRMTDRQQAPTLLTVPAIPEALRESSPVLPAIPPLSRGDGKRRCSHPPETVRRKKRKKSRTKAKIYLT